MNNYCIYIRNRKGKPFCKLLNKEIPFSCCQECINKEYKIRTLNKHQIKKKSALKEKNPLKSGKMKNKSNKLAKLERNRFSIIVDDLTKCCVTDCDCTEGIQLHEVFYGAYRHTSIKYGLVIPLCGLHHTIGEFAIHNNREMDLYYKRMGQTIFERKYSHELFMKEFKMDYLEKYEKEDVS